MGSIIIDSSWVDWNKPGKVSCSRTQHSGQVRVQSHLYSWVDWNKSGKVACLQGHNTVCQVRVQWVIIQLSWPGWDKSGKVTCSRTQHSRSLVRVQSHYTVELTGTNQVKCLSSRIITQWHSGHGFNNHLLQLRWDWNLSHVSPQKKLVLIYTAELTGIQLCTVLSSGFNLIYTVWVDWNKSGKVSCSRT